MAQLGYKKDVDALEEFMILLLLSGCSLEGDWIGNCTNAETGIQVFFEIDFEGKNGFCVFRFSTNSIP